MSKIITFIAAASLALAACGGSGEQKEEKKKKKDYKPDFKEQMLSGKINKNEWTFQTGSVRLTAIDSIYTYSFDLTDTTAADTCNIWQDGDYEKIIFAIRSDVEELATGVYPIKMSLFNMEKNQTVTLVYSEGDKAPNNSICTKGAIEIMEVTPNSISGRLDAYANDFSNVNGNFTATRCN